MRIAPRHFCPLLYLSSVKTTHFLTTIGVISACDPILVGVTRGQSPGKPYLSPPSISNIVKRIGQRYGIDKLSAHDCRHHCITYLIQQKRVNPMTVQDFGGWKDARMVRHYVRQLDVANADFVEGMYEE